MIPHPEHTWSGYAEQADTLIERYEAASFEHKHASVLHLLPLPPAWVLDIGAGTGADAAWFAARGHPVVGVEPVAEFRAAAQRLHPHPGIEWLDDSLPALAQLGARSRQFSLILLNAVWMHLDAARREAGMARVAALLAPAGLLVMSLRHGEVPQGRVMFEVSGAETSALAQQHGLAVVLQQDEPSTTAFNLAAGVYWTRLVLRAPSPGAARR